MTSLLLGATSSGGLQSDCGFEGIIDPPLKTGQSTDHDDPGHETSPKALESDLRVDLSDLSTQSGRLVGLISSCDELGQDGVSGVRNDGAEDTGEVT